MLMATIVHRARPEHQRPRTAQLAKQTETGLEYEKSCLFPNSLFFIPMQPLADLLLGFPRLFREVFQEPLSIAFHGLEFFPGKVPDLMSPVDDVVPKFLTKRFLSHRIFHPW